MLPARILDLPPIPEKYLPVWQALPRDKNHNPMCYQPPRKASRQGKIVDCGVQFRWTADNAFLHDWVKTNIVEEWADITWRITTPSCHGPHRDSARLWSLTYCIDSGGDDVEHVYYEPKDQGMLLEGNHVNDYDSLDPVFSVKQPNGTWILLDGQPIHSVENLLQERLTFALSFKTQMP